MPRPITRAIHWRLLRGRHCRLLRGPVVIVILALLATSCATSPPPSFNYANGTDSEGRPRPLRFLILPCNVTIPVPEMLASTQGNVIGEMIAFLRERGDSIEILESNRASDLWIASIAEVEKSTTLAHGYESAVRVFVLHISKLFSFDAVIMPILVYRDTDIQVKQRQVKWDGVIRRYRVVNISDRAQKLKLATAISPTIPGVSLRLVILSPEGESIFEKYGGLDITHDVDMTKSEITMTSDLVRREKLLADSDYMREGIVVAFDPYLPRD